MEMAFAAVTWEFLRAATFLRLFYLFDMHAWMDYSSGGNTVTFTSFFRVYVCTVNVHTQHCTSSLLVQIHPCIHSSIGELHYIRKSWNGKTKQILSSILLYYTLTSSFLGRWGMYISLVSPLIDRSSLINQSIRSDQISTLTESYLFITPSPAYLPTLLTILADCYSIYLPNIISNNHT